MRLVATLSCVLCSLAPPSAAGAEVPDGVEQVQHLAGAKVAIANYPAIRVRWAAGRGQYRPAKAA